MSGCGYSPHCPQPSEPSMSPRAPCPHHHARACRHAADMLAGTPLARQQALTLGVMLLVLAHGVATRRRLALHLGTAALALTAVVALPGHPVRLTVLGAVLVALVALRDEFATRPDARRLRLAGLVGGGRVRAGRRRAAAGTSRSSGTIRARSARRCWPASRRACRTPSLGPVLAVLVAAGGIVVLVLALAPAGPPPPGSAGQRAWVAGLTDDAGADSLAPFATRRDKTYVFSPDQRAAIGYRVFFGTALAGGDPVGDPESAGDAVAAFLETCTPQRLAARGARRRSADAHPLAPARHARAGRRRRGDPAPGDVQPRVPPDAQRAPVRRAHPQRRGHRQHRPADRRAGADPPAGTRRLARRAARARLRDEPRPGPDGPAPTAWSPRPTCRRASRWRSPGSPSARAAGC